MVSWSISKPNSSNIWRALLKSFTSPPQLALTQQSKQRSQSLHTHTHTHTRTHTHTHTHTHLWITQRPMSERFYSPKLGTGFTKIRISEGCTVVWWLAPSPHSKRVPGSIPTWGLSVWSLHVLPMYASVLSGYSGPSKNMHVRLIGVSKLSLGVSVSVCGC